jgi:hypothetical protein
MAQQMQNMATDPRVAVPMAQNIANSGATVSAEDGEVVINQEE